MNMKHKPYKWIFPHFVVSSQQQNITLQKKNVLNWFYNHQLKLGKKMKSQKNRINVVI